MFPVTFCTAKRKDYMTKWYPCEKECIGVVLSIDQCSHWIGESNLPTLVRPDSVVVISGRDFRTQSGYSLVLPYKPFSSNVISHISPDPSILNYLVTVVLERRSTGDADRWNGIIKRTRVNNGCHSSKGVEVQDT